MIGGAGAGAGAGVRAGSAGEAPSELKAVLLKPDEQFTPEDVEQLLAMIRREQPDAKRD